MPIQILATKLHPPMAGNWVQRASLLERLQAGMRGKVTIISAPPGFGKTTLLAAWIASHPENRVAWYSLDEDDNDPARFFAYIAASLRTVAPDSVSTLDSTLEAGSAAPREFAAALINDVSEFASNDIVLVLDDYHHITQQPIHDALAYLIDHLPRSIHIVFISRADPPLPLGRWRARGQLTEIRADDLRFSEEEAAQFLNQTMGLSLSAADIRTLEARTEGWAAGLQLAALSLQKSSNPHEVIAAFAGSHRFIADYLTDEVLARQPEALRDFLLKTSILERFNAPLCNAVLNVNHAEATLAELERANLFLIPLDSESNWRRYHHLFADLLRRRLAQAHPNEIPELHRRAAEWFEKNGLPLEAVRHWLAADAPERVAALGKGQKALFALAFLAVFREGIELALFLLAARLTSSPLQTVSGALLGLISAGILGWILFTSTMRLSLRNFFGATNILLIIFAAGLVGLGVHEFNEAGIIPSVIENVWDINPILSDKSEIGLLLKALVGYNGNPSLTEVGAYISYLAVLVVILMTQRREQNAVSVTTK